MADPTLLEGVSAKIVETARLRTHMLTGGDERGKPVFFVHGNVSSSRFFEETVAALLSEAAYWGLAPDLRVFGGSETKPLDAAWGLEDFSGDLYALADALGLEGVRGPRHPNLARARREPLPDAGPEAARGRRPDQHANVPGVERDGFLIRAVGESRRGLGLGGRDDVVPLARNVEHGAPDVGEVHPAPAELH